MCDLERRTSKYEIVKNIDDLESHLTNIGHKQHAIHTEPLIRRESVYANDLMRI